MAMGDEVGIPVGVKSSKKWIWIFVVGIVLVLLVVGGLYWYAGYEIERERIIVNEYLYKYFKCLDYCPTISTYSEVKTNIEPEVRKEFVEKINQECLHSCFDVNQRSSEEIEATAIRNSPLKIFLSDKRVGNILEISPLAWPESPCLVDVLKYGNKSCLENYFLENEKFHSEIIIPEYKNVTLDIAGLECKEDGFNIYVSIIEGDIVKLVMLLTYQGDGYRIEIDENEIGNHSFFVSSDRYSELKGLDSVGITYMVENSKYPMGVSRDIVTSRLCE